MEHLGPNIQISVTKNQTLAIVFQPVACLLNFVVCYGKKKRGLFFKAEVIVTLRHIEASLQPVNVMFC